MAEGFVCRRGGGGIKLPDTVTAGDTILYAKLASASTASTTYVNVPGYGFQVSGAGTYRIVFAFRAEGAGTYYAKLTRNGSDVASSEASTTDRYIPYVKTIDVTLSANDIVRLQAKNSYSPAVNTLIDYMAVKALAADLQTALTAKISAV